jgi:hypothetical protein
MLATNSANKNEQVRNDVYFLCCSASTKRYYFIYEVPGLHPGLYCLAALQQKKEADSGQSKYYIQAKTFLIFSRKA